MIKIITAIGNKNLNNKLKEENNFEIMAEDIQYKEGILEFLEQEKNIDFLILSELLPGEIELKELIEKIKIINFKIQIILFLEEKNQELENYLYAKGIYFIFYNNQIKISEIIELIKNEEQDTNKQLKKELEELKQILLEKENTENKKLNFFNQKKINSKNNNINNNQKNDLINFINNYRNNKNINFNNLIDNNLDNSIEINPNNNSNNLKSNNQNNYLDNSPNNQENNLNQKINSAISNLKEKNNKKEVICVSGTSGVGKSIFSINLAKSFMDIKNKILIIDFDILSNSLHTILGIKKYPEKIKNKIKNNDLLQEIKIEDLIIKVNSKIDLISGINLLFDSQYKISSIKIKTILSKLKEKYETIIIDTSSECFFDYTKEIMKNSNVNIFITEANLLEIKKAKRLLNIYINEWEISQNNFNILFNKYNENSIDISILKNIFSGFSILGKLSVNSNYNLLINKNNTHNLERNLKKEYLQINQKLLKENKDLNSKNNENNFLKIFPQFFKR